MNDWDNLYRPLRSAGVVSNQRAFSTMVGGGPSLMSSSKARGRPPSLSSLAGLFACLDELDQDARSILMSGLPMSEEDQQAAAAVYRVREEALQAIKHRLLRGRKGGEA